MYHLIGDGVSSPEGLLAAARLEAARATAFGQCAEGYIGAHQAGWKNSKHAAQWRNTLATYVTPVFDRWLNQHIDTTRIMKALDPIWRSKPVTTSRLRGRIEADRGDRLRHINSLRRRSGNSSLGHFKKAEPLPPYRPKGIIDYGNSRDVYD